MVATEYRIKWCNHSMNVFSQLSHLLEHETLVDVTLMCNENSLKVHKLMLAACSPYFEHVLQRELGDHPLIVLKDMQFTVLRSIIEFMYYGETFISEDNVDSLIAAAKFFEIKGLSDMSVSKNGRKNKASPFTKDNIHIVSGFSTGHRGTTDPSSSISSPASINLNSSAFAKISTAKGGRRKSSNSLNKSRSRHNSESSTTSDLSPSTASATAIIRPSVCTIEPAQQQRVLLSLRTDSPSSVDNNFYHHHHHHRTRIRNIHSNNNNNISITSVNEDYRQPNSNEPTANDGGADSLDENNSPSTVCCEPSDSGYKSDSVSSSLDSFTNALISNNTASSSGSESPAFRLASSNHNLNHHHHNNSCSSGTCSPLKRSPIPRIDCTSFYSNFRNLFKTIGGPNNNNHNNNHNHIDNNCNNTNDINSNNNNNNHNDSLAEEDADDGNHKQLSPSTTQDSPLLASLLTKRNNNGHHSAGDVNNEKLNNKIAPLVNISRGILTLDGNIAKPKPIVAAGNICSIDNLFLNKTAAADLSPRKHHDDDISLEYHPFIVDVGGAVESSSLSWDDNSVFITAAVAANHQPCVDVTTTTTTGNAGDNNSTLDLVESFDLNDAEVISLTNEMEKHLINTASAAVPVTNVFSSTVAATTINNNNNNNNNNADISSGFMQIRIGSSGNNVANDSSFTLDSDNCNENRFFQPIESTEDTMHKQVIIDDDDDVKVTSKKIIEQQQDERTAIGRLMTDELNACTNEGDDPNAVVLFRETCDGKLEKYVISSKQIENLKLMNQKYRQLNNSCSSSSSSRITVSEILNDNKDSNDDANEENGVFARVIDYKCSPTRTVDNILFNKLPFEKVFNGGIDVLLQEEEEEEETRLKEEEDERDRGDNKHNGGTANGNMMDGLVMVDRELDDRHHEENMLDELDNNRQQFLRHNNNHSLDVEFETCQLTSMIAPIRLVGGGRSRNDNDSSYYSDNHSTIADNEILLIGRKGGGDLQLMAGDDICTTAGDQMMFGSDCKDLLLNDDDNEMLNESTDVKDKILLIDGKNGDLQQLDDNIDDSSNPLSKEAVGDMIFGSSDCKNLLLNSSADDQDHPLVFHHHHHSYRHTDDETNNEEEVISKNLADHMLDHSYLLLPSTNDDHGNDYADDEDAVASLENDHPTLLIDSNNSSPSSHIRRRCHHGNNPFETRDDDVLLSNDVLITTDDIISSLNDDRDDVIVDDDDETESNVANSLTCMMNLSSSTTSSCDDVFSLNTSAVVSAIDDNSSSYDDNGIYDNSKCYNFNWLTCSTSSTSTSTSTTTTDDASSSSAATSFSTPPNSSSITLLGKRKYQDYQDDDDDDDGNGEVAVYFDNYKKSKKSIDHDNSSVVDFEDCETSLIEEIVYDELQSVT